MTNTDLWEVAMSTYIKISQSKTQIELKTANYVMAQEIPEDIILPEILKELKNNKVVIYKSDSELELVVDTGLINYNFKDIIWGELNIDINGKVQPINVIGLYNLLSNTFIEKPLEIVIVSPEVYISNKTNNVDDPKKKEIIEKLNKFYSNTKSRKEKSKEKYRKSGVNTSSFIKTKKERNTTIKCVKCGKSFKVPQGTIIKEYTCYDCSTREGYMPEPSLPGKVPFARFNTSNVIHFKQGSRGERKKTSLKEDISLIKYMLREKKKNS